MSSSLPDEDLATIPAADLERLMALARAANSWLREGPRWITAIAGDEAREFHPDRECAAFDRFTRRHPDAQTSFYFCLSGEQVGEMGVLCGSLSHLLGDDADEENEALPAAPAGEVDDLELQADADQQEQLELQQRLAEAADSSQFGCNECHKPGLVSQTNLVAVSLGRSPCSPMEVESAEIETLVCPHCHSREDRPISTARRREAFCRLIANRLRLDRPVASEDLYTGFGELYEQVLYSANLMLEMLQECTEVLHIPDAATFDQDGIFTGYYLMDAGDEWETEVYEQLEALGVLQCVGGRLYKAVPAAKQPMNPFLAPLMDRSGASGGHRH